MTNYDIRPLQLKLLDILKAFDEICRKHQLRYYLEYGTLLGAVRHGGFIPWDDDLDIAMPRPDYEKLILHAKEWFSYPYEFVCFENDADYPLQFGKVQDASTTIVERPHLYYLGGAYIDIFPLDALPDDEAEQRKHYAQYRKLKKLLYQTWRDPYKHGHGPSSWWSLLLRKIYPPREVQRRIRALSLKYPWREDGKAANLFGRRLIVQDVANDLGAGKPIDFEGCSFMSVLNPDKHLSEVYGDYMTPPPPPKIEQHAFRYLDLENPYRDFDPKSIGLVNPYIPPM